MSRLYQVLENARHEQEKLKTIQIEANSFHPPPLKSEVEMVGLYHAITAAISKKGSRIVEFVGTHVGDGCTTVVRHFARTAATNSAESVLLLDLNSPSTSTDITGDVAFQYHFEKLNQQTTSLEWTFHRTDQDNLTITTVSPLSDSAIAVLSMSDNEDLWQRLEEQFTLIVIDAPAATVSPIPFSLVKRADGVVLVIRAEKTRWPVAVSVKERIIREGGKIIGAVYNDRRHYVPKWLNHYL